MGFDEDQILPAVLDEYQHGTDFCQAERIYIHILLALLYWKNGLSLHKILKKLDQLTTGNTQKELLAALGNGSAEYAADVDILTELVRKEQNDVSHPHHDVIS